MVDPTTTETGGAGLAGVRMDSLDTPEFSRPDPQAVHATTCAQAAARWNRITPARLDSLKFGFVTRRVPRGTIGTLLTQGARPAAGQLLLARITRLGLHGRLQLPNGRRTQLFRDDEVVLAYGARYAPDQYEARVPLDLGACHLIAAGGLAGQALSWPRRVREPTQILPIGLLGDHEGRALNLAEFALGRAEASSSGPVPVVAVVGTAMNAGKTTAAASLIRGATRAGLRVGAAKVTGTGAGNDYWMFVDAGAATVFDFTDCGFASTYLVGGATVERIFAQLVCHLQAKTHDLIVLEVADGLFQTETATLLRSPLFQNLVDGVVFCAGDALGASGGVDWLEQRGLPVLGVSGTLTAVPLAAREAAANTDLPVWTRSHLADPGRIRHVLAQLGGRKAREALG